MKLTTLVSSLVQQERQGACAAGNACPSYWGNRRHCPASKEIRSPSKLD